MMLSQCSWSKDRETILQPIIKYLWPNSPTKVLLSSDELRQLTMWPRRVKTSPKWQNNNILCGRDNNTNFSNVTVTVAKKDIHFNRTDSYQKLNRSHQIIIFRLILGHNQMNYHLFTKIDQYLWFTTAE